jgi:hypothetical protein
VSYCQRWGTLELFFFFSGFCKKKQTTWKFYHLQFIKSNSSISTFIRHGYISQVLQSQLDDTLAQSDLSDVLISSQARVESELKFLNDSVKNLRERGEVLGEIEQGLGEGCGEGGSKDPLVGVVPDSKLGAQLMELIAEDCAIEVK